MTKHPKNADIDDLYNGMTLAQGQAMALIEAIQVGELSSPIKTIDLTTIISVVGEKLQEASKQAALLWDAVNGAIPGSPWIWSDDVLPPLGVPVLCLDDANKPQDVCVATRDNDWEGCLCWWMHIPPVPPANAGGKS